MTQPCDKPPLKSTHIKEQEPSVNGHLTTVRVTIKNLLLIRFALSGVRRLLGISFSLRQPALAISKTSGAQDRRRRTMREKEGSTPENGNRRSLECLGDNQHKLAQPNAMTAKPASRKRVNQSQRWLF